MRTALQIYALEWEYLATVLDRLLLIVFSFIVFLVTFLMISVGEAMHFSYELSADADSSLQATKP
uniref:Small integral membrane protein 6 n=1 Tax=Angiostrongylus cantonensis TaxID=6313 RepID=A0A0K0DEF7_ANGCA